MQAYQIPVQYPLHSKVELEGLQIISLPNVVLTRPSSQEDCGLTKANAFSIKCFSVSKRKSLANSLSMISLWN